MAMLKKLAVLAAAAEAARRYAKKNPDQAAKYVDQAADFVDKQTKGKYSRPDQRRRAEGEVRGGHRTGRAATGVDNAGSGGGRRPAGSLRRAPTTPAAVAARPPGVDDPGPVTP